MTDSYCLWCHRSLKYESTLKNLFHIDDVLCEKCRQSMEYKPKKIKIHGIEVQGLYIYEGLFRDMLIQYKELYDEALFPVFLWKVKQELERKYRGYTIVPVPSSERKNQERGFFTVERMFEVLDLPILDLLYKTDDHEQKKMNRRERESIYSHLEMKDVKSIPDKILLVDDIMTTGETITAAYRKLKGNSKCTKVLICGYNKAFSGNSVPSFVYKGGIVGYNICKALFIHGKAERFYKKC